MEYIDLVNKIVAAERSAKEIAREAKERESVLGADLERECAAMRATYMERAQHRVEQVRQTEAESAGESIAALDEKLHTAMDAVESSYAKNKAIWVDSLCARIVGGQA